MSIPPQAGDKVAGEIDPTALISSAGFRLAFATGFTAFLALGNPASAAVVVSYAATSNMACAAGVCTATAFDAVLNMKQLHAMLASGNAKIATGTATNKIRIASPLSWASANTLTLDSSGSIRISAPVTVTGPGGVSLVTNDGGTGGDLSFAPKGNLTFWDMSSALTINGSTYTLVNNIATMASDANANWWTNLALANDYNAKPDGTYSDAPVSTLWGNFEGLGHTISNLSVVGSGEPAALIAFGENVENFSLANVHVVGSGSEGVGGLVANGGNISNVTVTGYVEGDGPNAWTGFIAGVGGMMRNVHASGHLVINGGGSAGGLVGDNLGTISRSSAHVEITGDGGGVGGLVSLNERGTIEDSFATGSVSGVYYVGGLVGYNCAQILRSYATGAATSTGTGQYAAVGGFAGANAPARQTDSPKIVDSYATGTVRGGTTAGGFVGESQSPIKDSYATGKVLGASVKGGFVGDDTSTHGIIDSYWDTTRGIVNTSRGAGNIANDPGIQGLTTLRLQSALPSGFSTNVWGENPSVNGGLPYLLALPPQ